MNKYDRQQVREIAQAFYEQTGSENKYRLAWLILEKYPNLAVAIIRKFLVEFLNYRQPNEEG